MIHVIHINKYQNGRLICLFLGDSPNFASFASDFSIMLLIKLLNFSDSSLSI